MNNDSHMSGFSLIETLVVISLFAVLAIISTQAIISTLTLGRKAESSVKNRESVEYSLSVIERNLRNALSVESTSTNQVSFTDVDGVLNNFICVNTTSESETGHILFNSNQISSSDITITGCSFSVVSGTSGIPDRVMVSLSGQPKNQSGTEKTPITVSTIVYLRVY